MLWYLKIWDFFSLLEDKKAGMLGDWEASYTFGVRDEKKALNRKVFFYVLVVCFSQSKSIEGQRCFGSDDHFYFGLIYPSQRQNLLPTLEIITHDFQIFQKIQNFGKKIQNFGEKIPKSRIFFQNFQNHKGAATDIKGAAASLLDNYKIFIFIKSFQSSGYIT